MINYDIAIVNVNGVDDLDISTGDFGFVPSDEQHIKDTINAFPGWWKEYPQDGVGLAAWIGGPVDIQGLTKSIRLNLQADNYVVSNPSITIDASGNLVINPNATTNPQ